MAKDLHRQPRDPHKRWCCPPPWTHLASTPMPLGTWTINQTLQMRIWCTMHGILRHDCQIGRDQDEQEKAGGNKRVETPYLSQGNPVIHWICKLLQDIHPRLLQHCCPSQPAHLQRRALGLDMTPTGGFWMTQIYFLLHTSPLNPRCNSPLLHYNRCFIAGSQSYTHASWWKFKPAPLHLLLSHLLLCPTKP